MDEEERSLARKTFEAREQLYSLYHFLHQLNLYRDPQVRNKCVGLMQGIAGPAV